MSNNLKVNSKTQILEFKRKHNNLVDSVEDLAEDLEEIPNVEEAESGTIVNALGLDSEGKLVKGTISGGTQLYHHKITGNFGVGGDLVDLTNAIVVCNLPTLTGDDLVWIFQDSYPSDDKKVALCSVYATILYNGNNYSYVAKIYGGSLWAKNSDGTPFVCAGGRTGELTSDIVTPL